MVRMELSDSEVFKPKTDEDFARLRTSKNRRGLTCGVGVNNCEIFTMRHGVVMYEYKLWGDMINRCYGESSVRFYGDVTVDNSWLYFTKFLKDVKGLKSYEKILDGWVLDKDLLSGTNKVYSKDTCCIIPKALNVLFSTARAIRGELPVGVHKTRSGKFVAEAYKDGVKNYLGNYSTPDDAFLAYKTFKEDNIKRLAKMYKEDIDTRVYEKLMTHKVNIND